MVKILINNLAIASLLFFVFNGCQKNASVKYSFFVAGHAYGSTNDENIGLHPPFVKSFPALNQNNNLAFGFLTGDIVRFPWASYWEAVQKELGGLNCEVHLAAGNHDIGDQKLFDKYYSKTFYSFEHEKDLFIILDGNKNNWNIEGEQLAFLKNTLKQKKTGTRNIFIFIHQLIWWQQETIFGSCQPNSLMHQSDSLTFHPEILPLLQSMDKPVFMFAGDIGVFKDKCSLFLHKINNVTLLGSGMGNYLTDNYLLVDVLENGEVKINIIGLNCEVGNNCLGEIEDY